MTLMTQVLTHVLVYQLLDYYILLLWPPITSDNYDIRYTIPTFVIVSLGHVRTLFDVIRDPSRTTVRRQPQ